MKIISVDYHNPKQTSDLVHLLNGYALDPMGGAQALSEQVQADLPAALAKLPNAFSFICYINDQPAGLVNCLEGFSTFKCKPLMNIHDIVVASDFRGQGISQSLLQRVEELARERGCCKITLEVLVGNKTAQNAYRKFGFAGYELDPEAGNALFWEKML